VSVAAVILAAGASIRMGRPKALIQWQGRPFFVHCVRRAEAAGCAPVVVVWGATPLPDVDGVQRVHNPGWEQGPLSSLQAGLRAVMPSDPSGVLVMTVDRPHVAEATLRALLEAHVRSPDVVVQPRLEETSGHPIVHPRAVVDALLQQAPSDSVRTVLGRPEVRRTRLRISVQDPAVLDNLDDPAALARFYAATESGELHRD
jgi:molybdenum cofactor cytidylyltransferase